MPASVQYSDEINADQAELGIYEFGSSQAIVSQSPNKPGKILIHIFGSKIEEVAELKHLILQKQIKPLPKIPPNNEPDTDYLDLIG
ncbi:hypothetical protein A2382_05325 [Candidatus Woesebacteria bacterium RIFOXYB1_FULL_38_16]|uniref:Uncharacterized protein n=1 Tax=Candidatus Woesebacteria bacterium RIFOXYB1_FULL_38_16 TaxID=1802538 RepID=A0A1F8CUR3_9BACT|nr:MAG: hypothetical protein A2191_03060 [Candidatus Woesebacteria bacterium RIFOXYA1_FULL_38_9]OGM80073.1 MAG: hypothetical protein A2382_05325 [Candidatus Woesebacteria bacterium RIFOXYB1_FULL_38_16]